MTSQKLPERPNLEQLKNQAKTLLRDARAKDPDALRRIKSLPAFASKPALDPDELALHDAQSVIAREHGFDSWNALKEHVEAKALSFDEAVDEFVRCATGDAARKARTLLALHPSIAHASLFAELVLADVDAVAKRLAARPELATTPGGPHGWTPLHHVCHTCLHSGAKELDALVAIAQRLLALGADPNGVYVWRWHPELPRTLLWASLCAVSHLPLAELLLEAGASATDGVSMHITAGGGNLAALELLHRYRADPNGIAGGVPPLVYVLGWCRDAIGPRWLLEHGADASLAWSQTGEAPIHVAARRWDVAMTELLVRHGADVRARTADGRSPHSIAALQGNDAVAEWLLAHGAIDELTPLERFASACARGDDDRARAMLDARPELRRELTDEHHRMLHRPAEKGDARVLATMLACGFDARAIDADGVTALHRAAMGGHADATRVLLEHGAPVDALDGMFAASPLVWAVEGRRHPGERADHVAVARLLLAAGCAPSWTPLEGAPSPEGTLEGLDDLVRAARGPARAT